MKRLLAGCLLLLLLAVSLAACAGQPAGNAADASPPVQETPVAPAAPAATVTPQPQATPQPYAPMDLFGSEFNPYGDMEMPDTFTVFAASFNKGSAKPGAKDQFVLSMTGSGDMFACVAYQADVAGLSEDDKNKRINEYLDGGFTEFEGAGGQIITVRQADSNDDRYAYVEADGSHGQLSGGCVIDITFFVDDADAEKYTKLVRDTYSMDALTPIAEHFDADTDFSECGIGVNLHKKEATAYVVYYVSDVEAVQQSLQKSLPGGWWEWNGMMQTSFSNGAIDSKLTFDSKGGAITIEQMNKEFHLPPGAEVSLSRLGFGFDEANVCGVYDQHEPHYMDIAIHRPEWGKHPDGWNIEHMDEVNGYGLMITYHAEEDKYRISLSKNNTNGVFNYFPATGEYVDEYPDPDTIKQMFNDAFGTQGEDFRTKPLAHFEQLVQERFGMSVAELYALPIR